LFGGQRTGFNIGEVRARTSPSISTRCNDGTSGRRMSPRCAKLAPKYQAPKSATAV
jgi:hypothetical protein